MDGYVCAIVKVMIILLFNKYKFTIQSKNALMINWIR